MVRRGALIVSALAAVALPSAASACRTAAQMRPFLFAELPPVPDDAVAAKVEIESDGWSPAHPEIRAHILTMLHGSAAGTMLLMRPNMVSTCDQVPQRGEVGIVVGRLISASDGTLVVEPERAPPRGPLPTAGGHRP